MKNIVDFAGLWFIGLAMGTSITGILSNPQYKLGEGLSEIIMFDKYPYLLPFLINAVFTAILVIIVLVMYPQFKDKNKQYKKMQGTMFL